MRNLLKTSVPPESQPERRRANTDADHNVIHLSLHVRVNDFPDIFLLFRVSRNKRDIVFSDKRGDAGGGGPREDKESILFAFWRQPLQNVVADVLGRSNAENLLDCHRGSDC
jgi:hypothetical protein